MSTADQSTQEPEVHKGLAGVVADVTAVSKVNPESNSLLYRGYPVQELAASRTIEEVALGRLREAQARDPRIGDVRGRGAMIAIELVSDLDLKTPAPQLAAAVNAACHERGLVTLTCGTYGNVFRFLPPLAAGDDLLSEGLDIFEQAFAASV